MRQLYDQLVRPGDLVFDVGAHIGNRTRALASLGCRVVAVEPQPDFARALRILFRHSQLVEVVEAAVTDTPGRASLSISERCPTVTTVATAWRDRRSRETGFRNVAWRAPIEVETTTLDALIERFGLPAFLKVDVEGSEPEVFAGLSRSVQALSFEYLPAAVEEVERSLARLRELGRYRFNWSIGESYRLENHVWVGENELLTWLTKRMPQRSGDVYAKLEP